MFEETDIKAGEIWLSNTSLPNNPNRKKPRPVLVVGDDSENNLSVVDIHYCIISSSSEVGEYDVVISKDRIEEIGLEKSSVIKTTKIYTFSRNILKQKIGDLPKDIYEEFKKKFKEFCNKIIENL